MADRINPNDRGKTTFFKRLLDLYFRTSSEVRALLIPNLDIWSTTQVNARNSVAHDAHLNENQYVKAHAAGLTTIALVSIHYLQIIGLNQDQIVDAIGKAKSFRSSTYLAQEHLT
ncbi:hypothetical protein ACXZ66_03580 [Corynebacterium sp. S7]